MSVHAGETGFRHDIEPWPEGRFFDYIFPLKGYNALMAGDSTLCLDYDSIHKNYYKKVLSYLRKLAGDLDAEDLTQEVFEKIHGGLGSLNDSAKLSSWIFTIALNTARDKIRKDRSKEPNLDFELSISPDPESPLIDRIADSNQQTPAEQYAYKEMVECYLNFVGNLPSLYYEVYAYSELEELTDLEISEKLALPLHTIKIRLHRARQKLYEELRAHCQCYHNKDGKLLAHRKKIASG